MKKIFVIVYILSLFSISCNTPKEPQNSQDHLIMSVLWHQQSAEMKALYYQSFNWAKYRITQELAEQSSKNKKAVIVDIDETMLDNSPFEANCVHTGKSYTTERWMEWTAKASAKALPGAVEFSHFAKSKDVDVFYISNRSIDEFDVTLKNLQKENFAFADSMHLFLKTNTSSKKLRRQIVANNYEIILLIGDNLGDFSEIFEDRSNNFGFNAVDENKELFGKKFVVLPNSMYGAWEKPILKSEKKLSDKEKFEFRKAALKGYK
ncbi:MAG TPA: 5'-nucleotidase, lipoprotein e(P4) family [Bacteroidales bacterium]|nr:5'-nucleotidase, lipoprotein e(P4) family [Bacteroidales bacterium]